MTSCRWLAALRRGQPFSPARWRWAIRSRLPSANCRAPSSVHGLRSTPHERPSAPAACECAPSAARSATHRRRIGRCLRAQPPGRPACASSSRSSRSRDRRSAAERSSRAFHHYGAVLDRYLRTQCLHTGQRAMRVSAGGEVRQPRGAFPRTPPAWHSDARWTCRLEAPASLAG